MMNQTIRPGRDYAALRKFRRQQQWNQIKWSLLSWLGFVGYVLVLGLIAFAFYAVAVAVMV